ncbi:MAG: Integral membrane protein TerC family protein [Syntrophaceae bacterium PtaB.Bin038]|jgi:hypothetical protein|nr:MAG: Integral membrane protein TerC family protein [Syntrophaceae bacterium PtaB.Bin038]
MDIPSAILIVLGLALFESITSIDNAIINAEILQGMQPRARRWFLTWGIIIAVFVVRGVLPWLIVWVMAPGVGPWGALTASLTGDPAALEAIQESAPVLLMGGGVFFVFLFFHWIFLEPKKIGLPVELVFARQGAWFYAVVSIVLTAIVWFALEEGPMLAFGAVVGSTAFFITHGFKRYAEEQEARMLSGEARMTDIGKILYLEVIDLTFSIDGVVGAFAFTLAVPLILLGNGIGAVVVRQLTVYGVDRIKKYVYLKNGAMYSVFILGCVMIAHGFGVHIPEWLAPLATFFIVGYFFLKSRWQARKARETS